MAREKKTVTIAFIKETVNRRNRQSTCVPEIREGWNSILSEVLLACNAYHGFGYLNETQVPPGHQPGIAKGADGQNIFPDPSRRFYY